MAARLTTSHNKGSDQFYDICCSVCEDDGINKEGLLYCHKCSKTYCDECVFMHNKVLKNHSVTAKDDSDNWPVTKTVDDTLELCEDHSTEKLTMFCEDHEQLLCHVCHLRNHKQCSHVVLLAEKCKSSTNITVSDFATKIEHFQKRLVEAVNRSEYNSKFLQISYEIILKEILDFRRQINESLDRVQQQTMNELDKLHSSLKNSLENERKQCETFISKLKLNDTKSINSPEKSFILCRKYLDQTASAEVFLRKVATNSDIEFQHNKDLEKFLAASTDLGQITSCVGVVYHQQVNPNKVIRVQEKSQFNVRTNSDKSYCTITGICEMSNGNLVISDYDNKCVKLLDKAYNVIGQVKLATNPRSICNIFPNEVAVIVSDSGSLNEIHFLQVDNGKIITIKHLQLNHSCYGLAHHKGDIFVTSDNALFQYTIDGRLVKKLYEDKSLKYSVLGVGVNPDGKRIYLTDIYNGRLVTLTMDGTVTATLQDPAFKYDLETYNLHVASTGHVFVFGNKSVSQVDTDCKKILATVDLDVRPISVYFNVDKSKLLVGMNDKDVMFEFKTTIS